MASKLSCGCTEKLFVEGSVDGGESWQWKEEVPNPAIGRASAKKLLKFLMDIYGHMEPTPQVRLLKERTYHQVIKETNVTAFPYGGSA